MLNKKISKYTIILIISIVLIIFNLFFWFMVLTGEVGGGGRPTDARRQSDIRQIGLAMEMYYEANNSKYLQSAIIPSGIGTFLNPIPRDPTTGNEYSWVNNNVPCDVLEVSQWYCAYGILEHTTTQVGSVLANQKGVKTLNWASTTILSNINCCLW
ncbi:MAG: hypothetical protein NTU58_00635 [Candidatus Nealsonbacteria bacterium]|nr:hypothetical protein [Candidatus Nealsonbacteria bacterium]